MKSRNHQLLTLLISVCILSCYSQSGTTDFYYYNGVKVFLEKNKKEIGITFEGQENYTAIASSFPFEGWNNISQPAEDDIRMAVQSDNPEVIVRKNIKTFYTIVERTEPISDEAYIEAVQRFKTLPGVISVSECYNGLEEGKLYLTNNLYVKLRTETDKVNMINLATQNNIEILGQTRFDRYWFVLSCNKNSLLNSRDAANAFHESGFFEYSEPAFRIQGFQTSTDQHFGSQWIITNTGQSGGTAGIDMKVEQAWTMTTGDPNIRTAVYDSGFETNHPDLQNNVANSGYDAMFSPLNPAQLYGDHGTSCAGIIAAEQDNTIGISGIAPRSKIYPVSIDFTVSPAPTGVQWANGFWTVAQNMGAEVINCSWKLSAQSNLVDNGITYALNQGRNGKGIVVVFSIGNNNNSNGEYPANSNADILTVGGVDRCGVRSGRSDIISGGCDPWGPSSKPGSSFGNKLDVVAGGTSIFTTDRQGGNGDDNGDYFSGFSGSSASAPAVSGVAALMMSIFPDMTRQDVNFFICLSAQKIRTDKYWYQNSTAHPISSWNNEVGYGLVDAFQAVKFASQVFCLNNSSLIFNNNVVPNFNKFISAGNTISSSSTVQNNARAIFHAGTEVKLANGFHSQSGSLFHAYIEGCSGNFQFRQASDETPGEQKENENKIADADVETIHFQIIPNPSTGIFKIDLGKEKEMDASTEITVTNLLGNLIFTRNPQTSDQFEFDLTDWPQGLYLVKVTHHGTSSTKKIIKN